MTQRPSSAEAALRPHLWPGERLLWAGRPRPRPLQAIMTAFLVPMVFAWGAFLVFWLYLVLSMDASVSLARAVILAVSAGLIVLFARFFARGFIRQQACYGVTDTRALISAGILRRTVNSIRLKALNGIEMSPPEGSFATIAFRQPAARTTAVAAFRRLLLGDSGSKFEEVANAKEVLAVLEAARRNAG